MTALVAISSLFSFLSFLFFWFIDREWTKKGILMSSVLSSLLAMFGLSQYFSTLQPESIFSVLWLKEYSIRFSLGLDGISAIGVVVVSIISPLLMGLLSARDPKSKYQLLLLQQSLCLAFILSQDFFFIALFWGLICIPGYFLVGLYGGVKKEKAAFNFLFSSSFSTVFFVLAVLIIFYYSRGESLEIASLRNVFFGKEKLFLLYKEFSPESVVGYLFLISLLIRCAAFPFQGWYKRSSAEMPTLTLILQNTLLAPLSMFMFLKVALIVFPDFLKKYDDILLGIALVNLLLACVTVLSRNEFKNIFPQFMTALVSMFLLALYSGTLQGHLGACFLIAASSINFAFLGSLSKLMKKRSDDHQVWSLQGLPKIRGLWFSAPFFTVAFFYSTIFLVAFPLTPAFVGNTALFMGVFYKSPWLSVVFLFYFLVLSYFVYKVLSRVSFGSFTEEAMKLKDLDKNERVVLLFFFAILILLAIYPSFLMDIISSSLIRLSQGQVL